MSTRPRSKAKRILVFDWDTQTLRVVHALLGKRGVKIDRLLSAAIPPDVDTANPEQMGRHIRRVLDQEGLSTRHAIVDIPRDQAILKTLSLPAAKSEDLPGMVAIQIAKELPFPVKEAVIDFAVGPPSEDGTRVEVLVAAVRYEVLEQYQATFAAAGLRLDRVGLRPYAHKVAVCKLLQFGLPERVLFLDLRPTLTEIDILCHGALAFSRAASVAIPQGMGDAPRLSIAGGNRDEEEDKARAELEDVAAALAGEKSPALRGASGVINALLQEVTRSIEAYRAIDVGATIDHVVIGGDLGVEEALGEAIEKRLSLSTELYNPATSFGWEPDEGAGASAFAAVLGLAIGHAEDDELHFDFLHPKRTVSVTQERLKKAPLVAAVMVLFLAAGVLGFARYTKPEREELNRIESEIFELEGKAPANRRFLALVEELKEFDDAQHVWVDVLHDIFSQLPPHQEMVVNHLDSNQRDGRVVLKTVATERDTATQLIRRLEEFRREGRTRPRFSVSMGQQTEKRGEKYPFVQDIRILLLNDETSDRNRSGG